MAYVQTITVTKPIEASLVKWVTPELRNHIRQTYSEDFLSTRQVITNNATQWVGRMSFSSETFFNAVMSDPVVIQAKNAWENHNSRVGATYQISGTTI